MNIKYNNVYVLFILLIILFFIVNLLIIDVGTLKLMDYILFCTILIIMIISFYTNVVIGLISSILTVFIFGSIIFYSNLFHDQMVGTDIYIWMIIFPVTALITGVFRESLEKMKNDANKMLEVQNLVTVDEITGLNNAKQFYYQLEKEITRSKRHGLELTVMLIQLSYFEEIFAVYGKDEMDSIIKALSDVMEKVTRFEDEWYRIDKDMFSIILTNTDEEGAGIVKDRLKKSIENIIIDKKNYRFEIKIALAECDQRIENVYAYKKLVEGKLEYDI